MITRLIWAGAVAGLISAPALAQYPSKPIRILVPFAAGGSADIGTRAVAQALSRSLGSPVVVETKPGADGQIAGVEVAKSAPDGYTLFMGSTTALFFVPAVRRTPPYDPASDFTPISSFYATSYFVFVHDRVPASSLRELIEYARTNPGKLAYGTGNSTSILVTAELLANANAEMFHVPYKGDAPVVLDLITGRIQMTIGSPGPAMPHVKNGKLRALATLLPERSALLPDVPTITEAGYPAPKVRGWGGFFAPAKLPTDITERLSREINAALRRADVREQLAKGGYEPLGSSPAELAALVKEQREVWRRAIREAGIKQE